MKITELSQVSITKIGHLYKNGVKIEPHEESTARFLLKYGFIIDVIKPQNTPKIHNPDFLINGVIWETKSPEGKSRNTIERKFHEASSQAANLILDLRRIKRPPMIAEKEAIKEFEKSSRIKHMMLITKNKKLLDYHK
ncbi:hypothetical protein IKT18_03800 [Candidatus Saccharibacteria bacterium]|nr:hypothetical protein [Candidatus Saccharibacteria bacterium]